MSVWLIVSLRFVVILTASMPADRGRIPAELAQLRDDLPKVALGTGIADDHLAGSHPGAHRREHAAHLARAVVGGRIVGADRDQKGDHAVQGRRAVRVLVVAGARDDVEEVDQRAGGTVPVGRHRYQEDLRLRDLLAYLLEPGNPVIGAVPAVELRYLEFPQVQRRGGAPLLVPPPAHPPRQFPPGRCPAPTSTGPTPPPPPTPLTHFIPPA